MGTIARARANTQTPDQLKQAEKRLLTTCQKDGYRYIARDYDEEMWVFKSKPVKSEVKGVWFSVATHCDYAWLKQNHHQLNIVTWEDEEPTLIANLLEEGKQ